MHLRYVIHCAGMPREEAVVVQTLPELLRTVEEYSHRYGLLDMLYLVGRA